MCIQKYNKLIFTLELNSNEELDIKILYRHLLHFFNEIFST